jgi:hypothetical protein
MKQKIYLLLLLVAIASVSVFYACNEVNASKLDVVNNIPPMDVHDIAFRQMIVDSIQKLPIEKRADYMNEVAPHLTPKLVKNLRNRGFTCDITSITYMLGKGRADSVTSGDGKKYSGTYGYVEGKPAGELFAVVKGNSECFKDSLIVFVACLNGTFEIEGDNTQALGSYDPVFVIEKGNGINSYVDYQTSIWLADIFDIKLTQGPGGKVLTPEEAYALEQKVGSIPVTAKVSPGDIFNLGNMTYTHNGKVIHAKL